MPTQSHYTPLARAVSALAGASMAAAHRTAARPSYGDDITPVLNRGRTTAEAAAILGIGRTRFLTLVKTEPMLKPIRLTDSGHPIWTDRILMDFLAAKEQARDLEVA